MTRRRAVFLDIDGTYAVGGVVPAGHLAAVQGARRAGHLVFLCTGRPRSLVPAHILAAGFDGLVAGGGAYVLVGDEVLADRRFPPALAARTVAVLDHHDVAYLLEAPDATYAPAGRLERVEQVLVSHLAGPSARRGTSDDPLAMLRVVQDHATVSFGKVTCLDSPVPVERLGAEIGAVAVLPSSIPGLDGTAGELFLPGVHKALGAQLVARHLGLAREDVVGIGDGVNDLEMLQYAGTGIAIEGADARLLAVADRTAPGPEREGLVTAFTQLGLI